MEIKELELCEIVTQKLKNGDAITDTELTVARKHYRSVVAFLRALKEPEYRLFLNSLDSNLQQLDSYHEFRKYRKIKE